jgi:hypothetical protein
MFILPTDFLLTIDFMELIFIVTVVDVKNMVNIPLIGFLLNYKYGLGPPVYHIIFH